MDSGAPPPASFLPMKPDTLELGGVLTGTLPHPQFILLRAPTFDLGI